LAHRKKVRRETVDLVPLLYIFSNNIRLT